MAIKSSVRSRLARGYVEESEGSSKEEEEEEEEEEGEGEEEGEERLMRAKVEEALPRKHRAEGRERELKREKEEGGGRQRRRGREEGEGEGRRGRRGRREGWESSGIKTYWKRRQRRWEGGPPTCILVLEGGKRGWRGRGGIVRNGE